MPTPLLLFAGSRTDSVSVVYGTLSEDNAYSNATYSDAGINVANGAAKVQFYDPAAAPLLSPFTVGEGHSLYFHAWVGMNFNGAGYNGAILIFYDSAGYPWIQVLAYGQWQYNSGTGAAPVWTDFGDNTYGMVGLNRNQGALDVKIDIAADGVHTVFMAANGLQAMAPVTFNQPLMTGLSYVVIQHDNSNTESVWSQILVTQDLSTVGATVTTCRGTAAGTHADWTGSVTDVNEVFTDLANSNQALAAGLSQSYDMGNVTVPEGSVIEGVFAFIIAKTDGTSPENISMLCRTGAAVDHESGNLNGVGVAWSGAGARYDVNPDTGEAWTQAEWNAPVQLGFTSEA